MSRPQVTPVDLSGAASTVANDELTTGAASKVNAIRGGFAPDPRSPAGRQLLAALKSLPDAGEVESKALKKSAKRLGRHLREGVAPPRAVVLAHGHYKAKGGRLSLPMWSKKVAAG